MIKAPVEYKRFGYKRMAHYAHERYAACKRLANFLWRNQLF